MRPLQNVCWQIWILENNFLYLAIGEGNFIKLVFSLNFCHWFFSRNDNFTILKFIKANLEFVTSFYIKTKCFKCFVTQTFKCWNAFMTQYRSLTSVRLFWCFFSLFKIISKLNGSRSYISEWCLIATNKHISTIEKSPKTSLLLSTS